MDAAQWVAVHQFSMFGRDLRKFVLADQAVAADERGRRNRALPYRPGAILGVAPQGVVVPVGHSDLAKGVHPGSRRSAAGPDGAREWRCENADGSGPPRL